MHVRSYARRYNILHLKHTTSNNLESGEVSTRPYMLTQHIVQRVKDGLRERYSYNV